MPSRTKIRFEAIERAQNVLTSAPIPRLEDVSKAHAVRILFPQIQEARSKGYTLQAICIMLLESGVPVSPGLLKSLLSDLKPEGENGIASRKERRRPPARSPAASSSPTVVTTPSVQAAPKSVPSHDSISTDVRRVGASGAAPKSVAVPIPEGSRPSSDRRSAFVPRPDTDEI